MKRVTRIGVATCALCALVSCELDDETKDPCDDTKASAIAVQVKVALHGQDPAHPPAIMSDKVPCGGVVKGEFELLGTVTPDGEFLSNWAGYNLSNKKDVVRIHYDAAGVGSGMKIITYDTLAPYDGGTYVLEL